MTILSCSVGALVGAAESLETAGLSAEVLARIDAADHFADAVDNTIEACLFTAIGESPRMHHEPLQSQQVGPLQLNRQSVDRFLKQILLRRGHERC